MWPFSHRQIFEGLRILASSYSRKKLNNVVSKLDASSSATSQSAAWEIAVASTCKKLFGKAFRYEEECRDGGCPDIFVSFLGREIVFDIYTPTGDQFRPKKYLDNYCEILEKFLSNKISVPKRLDLVFGEVWRTGVDGARYRTPSLGKRTSPSPKAVQTIIDSILSGASEFVVDEGSDERYKVQLSDAEKWLVKPFCSIPDSSFYTGDTFISNVRDKARNQLRPFSHDSLTGLMVCDGGHDELRCLDAVPDAASNNLPYKIQKLLADEGIHFYVCVGLRDKSRFSLGEARYMLGHDIVFNPNTDVEDRKKVEYFFDQLMPGVSIPAVPGRAAKSILEAEKRLEKSPFNSRGTILNVSKVDGVSFKTSSRRVLEAFLDSISNDALVDIDFVEKLKKLSRGKKIISIAYEEGSDGRDDDLIKFWLGDDVSAYSGKEMLDRIYSEK